MNYEPLSLEEDIYNVHNSAVERNGKRPNSISIEDVFFGDSGKGSVIAKYNSILANDQYPLYSLRYNGGGNAGHEAYIHGKKVVTHQLPMGVVQENAVAVISRGMLIHPEDLQSEVVMVEKSLGSQLPGNLVIDERALLGIDTHRALEHVLNQETSGGRGSTSRGIATGYASFYQRIPLTVKDLLSPNWKETFTSHYELYEKFLSGFLKDRLVREIPIEFVKEGKRNKRELGTVYDFLDRLDATRNFLEQFVSTDVYSLLRDAWKNPKIPFTIEGAQGAGIDPWHGVYPDVTASRPLSRFINDATYNVILPEEIALRAAVMKTTYLSSVGQRVLPTMRDEDYEQWIQEQFDERGRSTGRLRDIYPISVPIAQYLRVAAGYDYIVATHLDASKENTPINIIDFYTDKKSGELGQYLPYQDHLDTLDAHIVHFPGWDGEKVKTVHNFEELPDSAKKYLTYLSKAIAPVIMATTGPDLNDYVVKIKK